jgi:glutamate carboxypeptidase
MVIDRLSSALRGRIPEALRLTRRWVEQNSYSTNVLGVNAMGALLQEAFALPGLSPRVEAAGPRTGDHLFWATAAAAEQPAILLIGHHDTVFPPGHFEGWREQDGRAHGPGVLDMKGGLAIVWAVLGTLADAGLLAELPLVVASVADEEIGSASSRPHLEALARGAACALVFESGRPGDRIVTRRRGTGGARVAARGKAAHAGNAHQDGANAIWALARFVDRAQALTDYDRGLTVNVGTIRGGTASNTVPDAAEAWLDLRYESIADAQALSTALHEAAAGSELPGTALTVEVSLNRLPMEATPASLALYREYAACQRAAGLGDAEQPLVGGGSDANTVSAVGLPAIDGLGPRGAHFHTIDEYVELASFAPKAEALLRFLLGRAARLGSLESEEYDSGTR